MDTDQFFVLNLNLYIFAFYLIDCVCYLKLFLEEFFWNVSVNIFFIDWCSVAIIYREIFYIYRLTSTSYLSHLTNCFLFCSRIQSDEIYGPISLFWLILLLYGPLIYKVYTWWGCRLLIKFSIVVLHTYINHRRRICFLLHGDAFWGRVSFI